MDEEKVIWGSIIVFFAIFFLVGPTRFMRGLASVVSKGAIQAVVETIPKSQKMTGGIKFTPPFIPLSVAINSSGGIELSCNGRIPTPIGTFEIYSNVSFPQQKTLTVVIGDKKHIYNLGDRAFKVHLPNDIEGRSKVEYDGNGNIIVVVPKPV
jgi:hypothetical protein